MTPPKAPISGPARALADWIERVPDFWRPVANGAGFILILILARGGVFVPVVFAMVCLRSAHPVHELAVGVLALALAILGGGLSGLGYSIAGRWLRSIPRVGPYLAGWVTVAPYMVMASLIVRVIHSEPVLARPDVGDYVIVGLMIAVFGTQIGYMLFRRPATSKQPDSAVAG